VVDDPSVRGQVRGAAAAIVRFFQHASVPDELFFETIVMNSPPASAGRKHRPEVRALGGVRRIPRFAPLPTSPSMRRSVAPFARSSTRTSDAEVLDHIDQQLLADA
jgi:hypothetical protein